MRPPKKWANKEHEDANSEVAGRKEKRKKNDYPGASSKFWASPAVFFMGGAFSWTGAFLKDIYGSSHVDSESS